MLASGLTIRAEGKAPVQGGRVDTAFRQALDEAFRRGVLDALRGLAPDRQTPQDLETWQETVLSRAGDFVGAWRILAQEEKDGFLTLDAEVEIWSEKLVRAASTRRATATPAIRLVVLSEALPLLDPITDEDVDAGRSAAAALEAEMARRGAVIVAATDRAPWGLASGPASEENRTALAAGAARQRGAEAVLVVQVIRRGESLALAVQMIAVASETTLIAARADVGLLGGRSLAEAFAPAARQLAASCAPHLAAARSARAREAPQ